jgi:hypothetical protein
MMGLRKIDISKLIFIVLLIGGTFFVFDMMLSVIPWYQMQSIEIVQSKDKKFTPGEIMPVMIVRRALMAFEVHVVRELIKLGPYSDEMVWQVHEFYGVEPGLRKSKLFLKIPTLAMAPGMSGNSYIWKGTMMYSPFGGPEKTMVFKTEKFHIEVPDA